MLPVSTPGYAGALTGVAARATGAPAGPTSAAAWGNPGAVAAANCHVRPAGSPEPRVGDYAARTARRVPRAQEATPWTATTT